MTSIVAWLFSSFDHVYCQSHLESIVSFLKDFLNVISFNTKQLAASTLPVTGARGEEKEKPVEEISQVATTSKSAASAETKQSKGKVRQRARKANEEPTFNTKLSTPIEDIIEETLIEEKSDSQSSSPKSEKAVTKPKKKSKASKKEKVEQKSDDEDSKEFLFVKHNQTASNKNQKKQSSKAKKLEPQDTSENPIEDDIGYSFFPVKERTRKSKNKSLLEKRNSEEALTAVIAQGITKKKDPSKPSIIDHYKTKDRKVSPPRKESYTTPLASSSQDLVNKSQPKTEIKESKKVTSKVSYANIVTNSVPADFKFEEATNSDSDPVDPFLTPKLNKEASSSVEVLSQCSEDLEGSIEVAQVPSEPDLILVNTDNYQPYRTENTEQSEEQFLPKGGFIPGHTVESSIEIIQKSAESGEGSNITYSHFEENILTSVIKAPEPPKGSFSDNFVEEHFTQSQHFVHIESEVVNEEYSEEFNDQALKDIIDNIVGEDEPELSVSTSDQEEIDKLLAQNLALKADSSLDQQIHSTDVEKVNELFGINSLQNQDQLTLSTELFLKDQTKPEFEQENLPKQNGHIEDSDKDKESISELIGDLLAATVQQEIFTSSRPVTKQEVEDIVFREHLDFQQSAKPAVEEPVCVKSAYVSTEVQQEPGKLLVGLESEIIEDITQEKQNIEGSESDIEDEIQELEDEIIEKPYVIEESEITVSDINSDTPLLTDIIEGQQIQESLELENIKREPFKQEIRDLEAVITELISPYKSYIEDQIQDLEDKIIDKPYLIEESELTLPDIQIDNTASPGTVEEQDHILNQSESSDSKPIRQKTEIPASALAEESSFENQILYVEDQVTGKLEGIPSTTEESEIILSITPASQLIDQETEVLKAGISESIFPEKSIFEDHIQSLEEQIPEKLEKPYFTTEDTYSELAKGETESVKGEISESTSPEDSPVEQIPIIKDQVTKQLDGQCFIPENSEFTTSTTEESEIILSETPISKLLDQEAERSTEDHIQSVEEQILDKLQKQPFTTEDSYSESVKQETEPVKGEISESISPEKSSVEEEVQIIKHQVTEDSEEQLIPIENSEFTLNLISNQIESVKYHNTEKPIIEQVESTTPTDTVVVQDNTSTHSKSSKLVGQEIENIESELSEAISPEKSCSEDQIQKSITPEHTNIIISDINSENIISTDTVEDQQDKSVSQLEDSCTKPVEQVIKTFETNISELVNPEEESEDLAMAQIRVLTLNDKEHQESTIYRIEKNYTLQFRLGPSLLGRRIKLYCNYPRDINGVLEEFSRDSYQLLTWCQDEGCKNADDTALFAQIVAQVAGSFHYYFIYENENTEERQGSGYFLVDPVLKYGTDEELPLDCIQCQTVLSKYLGPFSTWEAKLRVAKESGYNMVHFTPIQELGASKSAYSLSEQLKLNTMFNEENGKKPTFEDIEKLTTKMRKEWKVISVCDIVLNHTANESEWTKDHPEATYNCVTCPYMRPAYLLDAALHLFSMDVKKGHYEDRGIPSEVSSEEHLNAIHYHFKLSVLEPLKIQELFMVDVNKYLEQFLTLSRRTPPLKDKEKEPLPEIKVIQDPEFRRLHSSIDLNLALKKYNSYRMDCFDEESRVKKCAEDLKVNLAKLNEVIEKEVTEDLNAAIENVIAGIRYFRVQADGPKLKEITSNNPLVSRYFTDYGFPKTIKEYEEIMYSENGKFLMAHNGWVMNSDPLKNFAEAGSKIYTRRELIAWGDSVKLRFGNKPEDCPFLWNHMRKYVEQTVKIFDGVRLDNCHSTPIPVAEYLLDCARKVRPDLFVVAELFTNSDLTDNIFVNRLGITSLIREAMSAWDSHEEGRLVYRYGGVPVGSFYQPNVRPLVPMVAHAMFLDLTHDNPSPVEKRSVFDLLPSTGLVNMACCASGSNRGYDELVPHHIHVVDETRQYTEWSDDESLVVGNVRYVNEKAGIIAAKRALNDLHFKLGSEGYDQVYVDQMDPDIVAVTRHNPETHTSYVLVAFTAFGHPDINAENYQRNIRPLRVEGVLDEIVLEASLSHVDDITGGSRFTKFENFIKDTKWINGLSEYYVSVKQNIQLNESDIFEEVDSGNPNIFQLNFKNFKPGTIAVVKVSLPEDLKKTISQIRGLIKSLSLKKGSDLTQIISKMTLGDLNRALYRCDQEERDEGNGFDVYNIPGFGSLVYCGFQGFMSMLANIRPNNDLGHPFCANLRGGNWMIEYIWKRLKVDEGTKELGQWIEENTKNLHVIPRYLIPSYFDVIVTGVYIQLLEQSFNLMSDFVTYGSTFVRGLSLGSLQFGGYVQSADLPVLSPNLAPPKPPTRKNKNGDTVQACVTLSAGLPHFSVGYMRNWGRDTFIALRGLFILTGRFEESRQHILGYAACLRHGLIPNLLDGGRNSRFNCRDAIWWWLYCIKSYCEEAPNGITILSDVVSRIFPTDESAPQLPGKVDQPLHDVIQEALKIHFQGLKFRERNAGRQIDEHMTDAGFNNQIGIHPETGFVFGGNQWNCGTWMDKMGSSDKAGNRGKPATPRDGSAVELVGLSKAALSWLWKLNKEGKYPYDGVQRVHKNGATTKWTFKDWADKIQRNFEKKFWIGPKPSAEESRPDLINKKNIYKDSFGASQHWTDYQLRCNFPIAMVAAPEMFDPQHAWAALEQAEKYLVGPLGMKTLDPEDWNYRGDYDNSNDSTDFHTAHGFNYHQGPEWVWPIGFFLRAKLIFAAQNGMLKETLASTKVILSKHFTELQVSPWRGLPELTNSSGAYCKDSSRTQAWSMSCVLEVLHDLQQIESKQVIVN